MRGCVKVRTRLVNLGVQYSHWSFGSGASRCPSIYSPRICSSSEDITLQRLRLCRSRDDASGIDVANCACNAPSASPIYFSSVKRRVCRWCLLRVPYSNLQSTRSYAHTRTLASSLQSPLRRNPASTNAEDAEVRRS